MRNTGRVVAGLAEAGPGSARRVGAATQAGESGCSALASREKRVRFYPGMAQCVAMSSRRSRRSRPSAILLYADTERSADPLYFGHFHVPDPFIAIGVGRKKIAVVSALEFGRALKESDFDEVLSLEEWSARAKRRWRVERAGAAEVIATLARSRKIRAFRVPDDFPTGLAFKLQRLGLRVEPAAGPIFPAREIKTAAEARALIEGNRCSALGIAAAEGLLRDSRVRSGRLWLDGRALTSERVKEAVEIACLRAGSVSLNTIVAGGDQACDPHCRGSGSLRANELIIVDVFPRVIATGFHGDMTRTFLKGTPSAAQVKLVETVRGGQKLALRSIRAGVNGRKAHESVTRFFDDAGFATKREASGSVGFFHGTGHGLGLEVHEPPRVSTVDYRLRRGSVVTVEPGLYYPGLGGCRIEDVVQVMKGPARLLSRYHYRWIIP